MTRDEKILSLWPIVQNTASAAARKWNCHRDDLIDLAWIAVILLIDSRPEMHGDELAKLATVTVQRRVTDHFRKRHCWGERGTSRERWIFDEQLANGVRHFDHRSQRAMEAIDARVGLSRIRSKLKPATKGTENHGYILERNMAITVAHVGYGMQLKPLAAIFGLSEASGSLIYRETLSRLRACAG